MATSLEGTEGVQRSSRTIKDFSDSMRKVLSTVALGAVVFPVVALFGGNTLEQVTTEIVGKATVFESQKQRDEQLLSRLGQLQADVSVLQRQQAALSSLPGISEEKLGLASTAARVDTVERRLAGLERAILSSPEKALALPLIRRDIDNVRESHASSMAAVKQSVDQVYDLTKWFIGALAVGVFSLAIANLFTKR